MLLGIDVGGTFTDAVIVQNGRVISHTKTPTTHGRLLEGIIQAMDGSLTGLLSGSVTRVALSTTVVTNAIVARELAQVGLLIIPGPGADLTQRLPVAPLELSGSVDHRGRETAALVEREITAARQLQNYALFAVSGKFSVRNPRQEQAVAGWLQQAFQPRHITVGAQLGGELNFWRRTCSAYYNAAVWPCFQQFADAVEAALRQRGIQAPVYILKADGGTMPLALAREMPVETIFTGPAASVLGIMAMARPAVPAVSLDIGGTTTDIALWEGGLPLFSRKGAVIAGYPTAVRGFGLKSVGVGGDSHVRWEDGQLQIGPRRLGPAMALGGAVPTVSDALIAAGLADFGDKSLALQAMRQLGGERFAWREAAQLVIGSAAQLICRGIDDLIAEWSADPVYRVEDIVRPAVFKPELVIGAGGAAGGLVPEIAARLELPYTVPAGSAVVNALGAAVARPTLAVTLRADTAAGVYTIAESGLQQAIPGRHFSLSAARDLAGHDLRERSERAGIPADELETVWQEEFSLVRGFNTVGKIITCKLQIKPGVLSVISGFAGEA